MANSNVDILLRVKDEATNKLRELSAETGGLVGTFQRLSTGLGVWGGLAGGIATAAGAAVAATSKISDMVEQLDRAKAITSIGIEPLQAMFKIVRDGGGDTEALVKALGHFKREIADANPILKQLGITQGSIQDRFLQLVGILARSSDEAKVSKAALDLLGKTGEQLIPHMAELAANTTSVQKAMEASGESIRTKVLPAYKDFDTASDKLRGDWKGTWNDLVTASVGPSTFIVRVIDGLLGAFRGFGRSFHDMTLGVLDDLAKADAATQSFDDRMKAAKEEARRTGGRVQVGVPTVSGVEVTASRHHDPLADWDPSRRAGSKKSPTILGPGSPSGIQSFIEAMMKEAAEQQKKELAAFMTRNIILPEMLGGGILPLPGGPGRIAGRQQKSDPFKDVVDAWKKAAGDITSSVSILRDSLEAVWSGLSQGISSVFVNLVNGSQTFAQGIRTIFKSLGESILDYLGKLVAAKVFQLFLNLLTFASPGLDGRMFGGLGGGDIPGVPLVAGPIPSSPTPQAFARGGLGGGNTFYIHTLAPKEILSSILSPTGAFRSANDRLIEVAAAS